MRVLWTSNILFPAMAAKLGHRPGHGGGWLQGLASQLCQSSAIEGLGICAEADIPGLIETEEGGVSFFLIPGKPGVRRTTAIKQMLQAFRPEILHIHGSEYAIGADILEHFSSERTLLTVQGLVSVYARYYCAGLTRGEIFRGITVRDIVRFDFLLTQQRDMTRRGAAERSMIQKLKYVSGRTEWDLAHVHEMNSKARYFHTGEVLRAPFYIAPKWTGRQTPEGRIFLSQAHYPIKGLHVALNILYQVRVHYPNATLVVAGVDFINGKGWRLGNYGRVILKRISQLGLEGAISFTGPLDANQMISEYLNCDLFLCPSAIENSPNSICEAQMLGVPVVAANVGGIQSLIQHRFNGLLYRFEEPEMAAHQIVSLLSDSEMCKSLAANGAAVAVARHDRQSIADQFVQVYGAICAS